MSTTAQSDGILQTGLLGAAAAGESGAIHGIDSGCLELGQLEALGLATGTRYTVLRGGDPLIVSVMGTRIALSREIADKLSTLRVAVQ